MRGLWLLPSLPEEPVHSHQLVSLSDVDERFISSVVYTAVFLVSFIRERITTLLTFLVLAS